MYHDKGIDRAMIRVRKWLVPSENPCQSIGAATGPLCSCQFPSDEEREGGLKLVQDLQIALAVLIVANHGADDVCVD